jgi:hypothetical protein
MEIFITTLLACLIHLIYLRYLCHYVFIFVALFILLRFCCWCRWLFGAFLFVYIFITLKYYQNVMQFMDTCTCMHIHLIIECINISGDLASGVTCRNTGTCTCITRQHSALLKNTGGVWVWQSACIACVIRDCQSHRCKSDRLLRTAVCCKSIVASAFYPRNKRWTGA